MPLREIWERGTEEANWKWKRSGKPNTLFSKILINIANGPHIIKKLFFCQIVAMLQCQMGVTLPAVSMYHFSSN